LINVGSGTLEKMSSLPMHIIGFFWIRCNDPPRSREQHGVIGQVLYGKVESVKFEESD